SNNRQQQRCRVREHVRRLGQQSDRVCEVAADSFDEGERAQDDQRDGETAFAGVVSVGVSTVSVSVMVLRAVAVMSVGPMVVGRTVVGRMVVGRMVVAVASAHADRMPPMGCGGQDGTSGWRAAKMAPFGGSPAALPGNSSLPWRVPPDRCWL